MISDNAHLLQTLDVLFVTRMGHVQRIDVAVEASAPGDMLRRSNTSVVSVRHTSGRIVLPLVQQPDWLD